MSEGVPGHDLHKLSVVFCSVANLRNKDRVREHNQTGQEGVFLWRIPTMYMRMLIVR